MARRLGWLVGLGGIVLVLARLGRVLETAVDTPDWRLVVPAAAVAGVLVTWATARWGHGRQAAAHVVGLAIVIVRVTAPETLNWGIVPGAETFPVLGERLAYAFDILRFGSPPVLAVAGLTALAAGALWLLGGAWGWSVAGGRVWAGIVPPLAFYLYLAVVDRAPSAPGWNLAFLAVAGLGLIATSNLVPAGAGHLRTPENTAQRRWHAGPAATAASGAAVIALFATSVLAGFIPAGGAIDWRASGGEGTGTGEGGFTASRFVGLRQSLISLSDQPVFRAVVDPGVPEGPAGYWRLLTLDRYTGVEWVAGDHEFGEVAEDSVEQPGETETITQTIQIESLRDDRLPSLAVPETVASEDPVIRSGTALGNDGNLRINALTRGRMTYRVQSSVPALDLGLLASRDGELSPMFAEAVESGELSLTPRRGSTAPPPADIGVYTELSGEIDPRIPQLAEQVTAAASTPFEAALLLEDFLRGFSYSTDVTTGQSTLELADWLTDPESPNYRTGYCEQFATAMAVLGRALSLPTRVVIGFTSGEVVETEDGPLHIVRERNAHAWVEVWIDGQGWVGFDPTPRSDGANTSMSSTIGFDPGELDLPARISSQGQVPGEIDFGDTIRDIPVGLGDAPLVEESQPGWIPVLVGGVVLVAALALPWIKLTRHRRRRRLAGRGDIEAVWAEITDRLADLGTGPASHQTPVEFARATHPALLPLAEAYSASIYGSYRPADATRHLEAAERWIETSFDRPQRTKAIFSIRSLR